MRPIRRILVYLCVITALTGAHLPLAAADSGPGEGVDSLDSPTRPTHLTRYHAPLDGELRVLRGFDPPDRPWQRGHRGVDLAGRPGDAVRAAAGGVVAFAGVIAGKSVVSIQTDTGERITYEPVAGSVRPGQRVEAGAVIGKLLPGHRRNALHFGVKIGAKQYANPLWFLRPRVRLYPLA